MLKRLARIIFLSILSIALISCDKENSRIKLPSSPKEPDKKPDPENNCKSILFDLNELKSNGIELPIVVDGFLILATSPLIECNETNEATKLSLPTTKRGYKNLSIIPPLIIDDLMTVNANGKSYDIIMKAKDLASTDLDKIASLLNPTLKPSETSKAIEVSTLSSLDIISKHSYLTVKNPEGHDMGIARVILKSKKEDRGTSKDILKINFKDNVNSEFLTQFNDGKLQFNLFITPSPQGVDLGFKSILHYTLSTQTAPLEIDTIAPSLHISQLWESYQSEVSLRFPIFEMTLQFLNSKVLTNLDFYSEPLSKMATDLKTLWDSRLNEIKTEEDLLVFKILGTIEPEDSPIIHQFSWFNRIAEFIKSEHEALNETLKFFQGEITEEQRVFVLNIAVSLSKIPLLTGGNSLAWKKANELALQFKWDVKKWVTYNNIIQWLTSSDGPQLEGDITLSEADAIFNLPTTTEPKLIEFKRTFEWLYASEGANLDRSEAYRRTKNYLISLGFTPEQFQLLVDIFNWFYSPGGPNLNRERSLLEVDIFIAKTTFAKERFELFTFCYQWLYDSNGINFTKSDSFERTKFYLFTKQITDSQFSFMKRVFSWYFSPNGPNFDSVDALNKMDLFLNSGKLNELNLKLMQRTFDWLSSSRGPGLEKLESISKVEFYIINQNADENILKRLKDSFDNKRTKEPNKDKKVALQEAEKEVFESK